MKEDILKYSPTVMFRGTPCMTTGKGGLLVQLMVNKRQNV